ncbi:MAG: hypothetical protein ACREAE_06080 [Nitrosopumilaceae archaeon]
MYGKDFVTDASLRKLKFITVLFLGAGIWGISFGLFVFNSFIVTLLGMVNLTLGVFLGFRIYNRSKKLTFKQ